MQEMENVKGHRENPTKRKRNKQYRPKAPPTSFNLNATEFMPKMQQGARPREKKVGQEDLEQYLNFKVSEKKEKRVALPKRKYSNYGPKDITLNPYYRFSLKIPGDYSYLHLDPDTVIDWDHISKVFRLVHQDHHCPICLETSFVAPRISKCGHSFCWPCITRYLASNVERKRCPICFDIVRGTLLRPVELLYVNNINEGSDVTFSLVRRERGTVSIYECGTTTQGYILQKFPDDRSNQAKYNKVLICIDPISELEKEMAEINAYQLAGDETESYAISKVKEYLNRDIENLTKFRDTQKFSQICNCDQTLDPITLNHSAPCPIHSPPEMFNKFDTSSLPITLEPERDAETYFYFYQSNDAQPFFLHPLNFRMLIREFGDYSGIPVNIKGKVLEIESIQIAESEQRKYKMFGHLAKGTSGYLVELDLKHLVSNETFNQFRDELHSRAERRRKAKKRERKQQAMVARRRKADEEASNLLVSYFENPKVAQPVSYTIPTIDKSPELQMQTSSTSTKQEDLKEEIKEEDENVKSVWCSFGDIIRKPARPGQPKLPAKSKPVEQALPKQYNDPELDQLIAVDESVRDYLADKKQTKLSDFIRFS